MNIIPRISVKAVQESGSTTQQATANYFDKNGNGILELEESDRFQKAKIEKTDKAIKIINADGSVDIFENMSIEHDEEYYSSGTIPVAVIDMFDTTAGNGWHGKHVCNMMKSVNPDISITKFDNSPTKTYNKFQMAVYNLISKNPKLDKFCSKHQPFKSIVNNILEDGQQTDAVEKCFDEVIQQMNNGKKFQAVNLSASQDCSYPEINRLVGNELGVEITPENIAKYKKQIKEVLETKQNKKFDSVGDPVKIKQTLDIIHKIESLNIPVYLASSYKNGKEDVFNIWALADNAKCIEGGKPQENDEMKTASYVSSSSLSIDETGKKRIENSIYYNQEAYKSPDSDERISEIADVSTSLATPMALAKDFKKKT